MFIQGEQIESRRNLARENAPSLNRLGCRLASSRWQRVCSAGGQLLAQWKDLPPSFPGTGFLILGFWWVESLHVGLSHIEYKLERRPYQNEHVNIEGNGGWRGEFQLGEQLGQTYKATHVYQSARTSAGKPTFRGTGKRKRHKSNKTGKHPTANIHVTIHIHSPKM